MSTVETTPTPIASTASTDTAGAAPRVATPALSVTNLSRSYGSGEATTHAVADFSLQVFPGELVTIVGPSGCGKSTILRCITGLLPPSGGTIEVAGSQVRGPASGLGVVFQDYSRSLFPWLTVGANVALPLAAQRVRKNARLSAAQQALADVGLAGTERKYPWQLSGGMQQRAAIARALISGPSLLLLDEPFAAVDAQTRADLQDVVLRLRAGNPDIAVVFVTHDIDEAVYLADRVVVLSAAPTTIQQEVIPELPDRRDQRTTKNLPQFAAARNTVLESIERERHQS